eukprot:GHUV01029653.1.p2 GENE.GHUV01029653.1~~GHUV01029653.1.p2  ORF type:complete len:128 (+),score=29.56 GHUV01029653.1:798-1181(+)
MNGNCCADGEHHLNFQFLVPICSHHCLSCCCAVYSLAAASSAVKQPLGMRSPVVGFVAEVANTLIQSCDASNVDSYCSELAELLNADEQWQGSIEPQGAIHSLLQEQEGQLCGEFVALLLHVFRWST